MHRKKATLRSIPFSQRLTLSLFGSFGLVIGITLTALWNVAELSARAVQAEIRQRGLAVARGLAWNLAQFDFTTQTAQLAQVTERLWQQENAAYVLIDDANANLVISTPPAAEIELAGLPDATCTDNAPVVRRALVGGQAVYDVSMAITSVRTGENAAPSSCRGTFHLGFPAQAADANQRLIRRTALLLTLFSSSLALFSVLRLSRRVLRPIRRVTDLAEHLAARALTDDSGAPPADELGRLEFAMARMRHAFESTTIELAATRAQHTALAAEIRVSAAEQANWTQQQAFALARLDQNLRTLGQQAQQSSEQAEKMVADVAQSVRTAQQTVELFSHITRALKALDTQEQQNIRRIVAVSEKITQISHNMNMLTTIANQTKIIAFNASIEASGAGEAGGRFAVVATEMRRLAATVGESVAEIQQEIAVLTSASRELVISAESGMHEVKQSAGWLAGIDHLLPELLAQLQRAVQLQDELTPRLAATRAELQNMQTELETIAAQAEQGDAMQLRLHAIAQELHAPDSVALVKHAP